MNYLIGIDIGTQGIKGVLLNQDLDKKAQVYLEHKNSATTAPGKMEHDANQIWWQGFKQIIYKLKERVKIKPEEIAGIACSALGPCLLPVTDGEPNRKALLYNDVRGDSEIAVIKRQIGKDMILQLNKNKLSNFFIGPKLVWFKENEPALFRKTDKILTASNYIIYKLSGEFVIDHAQAAFFNPFYNYEKRCWNKDILASFKIPVNILPSIVSAAEIVGRLTKTAARELDLISGIPIINSTIDSFAESISSGGFKPGITTLISGTTSTVMTLTENLPVIEKMMILPSPLFPELNIIVGATNTSGALTKWFRDNFAGSEKEVEQLTDINAYQLLSKAASKIAPGSEGLLILPYFNGERTPINDNNARGLISGLTIYHNRAHVYRALLESTGYAINHNLEFIKQVIDLTDIITSGGITRNKLWLQIVSDITGYPQRVLTNNTGAEIGSAYLAGLAVGLINDISEIEIKLRQNQQQITVNQENRKIYQEYYQLYKRLYLNTREELHHLAKLGQRDF